MSNHDKDDYFDVRDKLIKSLPEPEKSVFMYFRKVEQSNLEKFGRLVVSGKTPVEVTAEHFKMSVDETKVLCQNASNRLKNLIRNQ